MPTPLTVFNPNPGVAGMPDLVAFFKNATIPQFLNGSLTLTDSVDGLKMDLAFIPFGSLNDLLGINPPFIHQLQYAVPSLTVTRMADNLPLLTISSTNLQLPFTLEQLILSLQDFQAGGGTNPNGLMLTLFGGQAVTFQGGPLDDVFQGGSGPDVFYGGGGHDTFVGRGGDDTYYVQQVSPAQPVAVIMEQPFEGTDTVVSDIDFSLPANVENLILNGSAVNGTGNELSNVITGDAQDNTLKGLNGNDTLYGGGGLDLAYGGGGNDTIDGGAAADTLYGDDGDDSIDGGAGIDLMIGGAGNDSYFVDDTADVIIEENLPAAPIQVTVPKGSPTPVYTVGAYDKVYATATYTLSPYIEFLQLMGKQSIDGTGNDQDNLIIGNLANNVIRGMGGADVIDGKGGGDTLYGGPGDDIIYVYNTDLVIEEADEGKDTVLAWVTYTLTPNVENLTLIGTDDLDGTGNDLDNVIKGNPGDNRIDGGTGADQMAGGAGDDTYVIDDLGDTVTELAGQGIDTIETPFTTTLDTYLENLILTGEDPIDGTGNASANLIKGNDKANVIDGKAGADKMEGGRGDDTYYVDNVGDVVVEKISQGRDLVYSGVSYVLTANVEDLILTGTANLNGAGNALANSITGNTGANLLDGAHGADVMAGGAGNDTYVVDDPGDLVTEAFNEGVDLVKASITYALTANVENLTLTGADAIDGTGNNLFNIITGNSANNVLDGGGGAAIDVSVAAPDASDPGGVSLDKLPIFIGHDTLIGGLGNDTYMIRRASDLVKENVGEGTDTAVAFVSYTLAANVENLVLAGELGLSGTGNSLPNVITGNAGDNILDGKGGGDTLIGGQGDDSYYVDNGGDLVIEDPDSGHDSVFSSVSYLLPGNVEDLTLTGASGVNGYGNGLDNRLTGNSGANLLDGGAGADVMAGGLGNDTYVVDSSGDIVMEDTGAGTDTVRAFIDYTLPGNVERLVLLGTATHATGNELDNLLTGNALANFLDGGLGADTMAGGGGADTYYVDNAGDVVQEQVGGGPDLVVTTLNSYALPANVEQLMFQGSGDFNGMGNGDANTLYGGVGDDTLDGKGGADILQGHAGDDTYIVDNALDLVTELAGEGHDTIVGSVTYTLGQFVEDGVISGGSALSMTGNTEDNTLTGNGAANTLTGLGGDDHLLGKGGADNLSGGAGADILEGGAGADQMTGGLGADTFLFASLGDLPAPQQFDSILDFSHAEGDIIDLTGIDADTTAAGDQAFTFLGTKAFTHTPGELRYAVIGGSVVLGGDVNGDGLADFFIKLVGVTVLTAGDLHP